MSDKKVIVLYGAPECTDKVKSVLLSHYMQSVYVSMDIILRKMIEVLSPTIVFKADFLKDCREVFSRYYYSLVIDNYIEYINTLDNDIIVVDAIYTSEVNVLSKVLPIIQLYCGPTSCNGVTYNEILTTSNILFQLEKLLSAHSIEKSERKFSMRVNQKEKTITIIVRYSNANIISELKVYSFADFEKILSRCFIFDKVGFHSDYLCVTKNGFVSTIGYSVLNIPKLCNVEDC